MKVPQKIIISRTDSIGDVVLTLPMAGIIRKLYPAAEIIFLGSEYTRDIVGNCKHIDRFEAIEDFIELPEQDKIKVLMSWEADCFIHAFPIQALARLASLAKIRLRIGASGRVYHYIYCNKIVPLSRRRSQLHESQLNLRLLKPLGAKNNYSIEEIGELFGFETMHIANPFTQSLKKDKFNLILHPKSKGSAREWGLNNFRQLIDILPRDRFNVYITGTSKEGELIKNEMPLFFKGVNDLTGKLSLKELISFIQHADGLVAASTGPLHIAAISGKIAIGLYPPIRPMHPGRWAPIGNKATVLVADNECSECRGTYSCRCLSAISPELVKIKLAQMIND